MEMMEGWGHGNIDFTYGYTKFGFHVLLLIVCTG